MSWAIGEHALGESLRLTAHPAGHGACRDLSQQTIAEPGKQLSGIALQDRVAFRVSEDGREAGPAQLVESLFQVGREAVIREFDEEVVVTVDAVAFGRREGVLEVVVVEVEVAAEPDPERDAGAFQRGAELLGAPENELRLEAVAIAGVRRTDHVRDAVRDRDAGHLDGGGQIR